MLFNDFAKTIHQHHYHHHKLAGKLSHPKTAPSKVILFNTEKKVLGNKLKLNTSPLSRINKLISDFEIKTKIFRNLFALQC